MKNDAPTLSLLLEKADSALTVLESVGTVTGKEGAMLKTARAALNDAMAVLADEKNGIRRLLERL